MAKKKAKKYSKKKSEPNQPGPGFRTRRDFKVKQSMFHGGNVNNPKSSKKAGFNPSTFKTQHKG
jgi:hypothetical protein